MLSVDGRCKTWDARANGYVRSEGIGSAALQSGSAAPGGGAAALSGVAVRQDGRSASLTAPNGSAQQTLLRAALSVAGVPAAALGAMEAHGTGTALGDPTEAGSLVAVLGGGGEAPRAPAVVVSAAKASIGHSEAPSGQAGLLRAVEGLRRRGGGSNAALRVLNPLVAERASGGRVPTTPPLSLGTQLRQFDTEAAGVSSFGYSGTIASAVLRATRDAGGAVAPQLPRLTYRRRHFGWREQPPAASTAKHHRQRLAASRAAEHALDAAVVPGRTPPPTADVLVIGAGLAGLIVASRFAQAGARVVVLERSAQVGGVWRQHANPFSRVNSSEPSYRVPVRRAAPNTNHSHHSEILADALRLLRGEVEPPADAPPSASAAEGAQGGASPSLAGVIFLGCEVRSVQEAPVGQPSLPQQQPPVAGWNVVGVCGAEAEPFEVRSGTVVVCTNRRLGVPRSLTLRGEASFVGAVRRGLAGDSENVRWQGQRVVILGMGAFAIENMRTAFERGAAHVTLLCRRRGTVCPQLVDWLNFIRPWEVRDRPPRHMGHMDMDMDMDMGTWDMGMGMGMGMDMAWTWT
jgi:hypothetical protein